MLKIVFFNLSLPRVFDTISDVFLYGSFYLMTIAIYPGTFDPITHGHTDIVRRASDLFDHIIVAISANPQKKPRFSLEQRLEMANEVLASIKNVSVKSFDSLLVDFAKQESANVIIRGLRTTSDFDFEYQMALMNHRLYAEIDTIFFTPSEKYAFISSTLVREVLLYGGDVSQFVDARVQKIMSKDKNSQKRS